MGKKGYSVPSILGGYDHFDENGKKDGYSIHGILGGYDHYNSHGKKTGYSVEDAFGGYVHYDSHGKKTGYSIHAVLDGYDHYDRENHKTGYSNKSPLGGFDHYTSTSSGSCYIATCIYGSYDCPQVWTLRRFRDKTLSRHAPGRFLIRFYYRTSPRLIRQFGKNRLFRLTAHGLLDPFVSLLQKHGFESVPYPDDRFLPFSN